MANSRSLHFNACNIFCALVRISSTPSAAYAFQFQPRFSFARKHLRLFVTSNPSSNSQYSPVPFRSDALTHLDSVEDAVDAALLHYQSQLPGEKSLYAHDIITTFPAADRETIGVTSKLRKRLDSLARNRDCRRCWLQKRHCICEDCPPLESVASTTSSSGGIENVNSLFLLTHHKEICMVVDTAKIILSSFPNTTRLVVNGIGREFQPSMVEMLDAYYDALSGKSKCLILFPSDDAKTFEEIEKEIDYAASDVTLQDGWDVIVIDGTWSQAKKMYNRYFPDKSKNGLFRVKLSSNVVENLGGEGIDKGHQLRRHPTKWREISTHEATRLLLNDMHTEGQFEVQSEAMSRYQDILNSAARRQLGPPREKEANR